MKYFYNILFFLLLCLACSVDGQSDNFIFERFTQEDGLSGNAVYSIIQDKSGLLWIGTDKGLCSYDGYRFKEINVSANDITYGYKSPTVTDLFVDLQGNIRFKNSNFQYVYDKVSTPKVDLKLRLGISADEKRSILQIKSGRNGEIWAFYYDRTIGRYDFESRIFQNFTLGQSMHFEKLSKMPIRYLDKQGNIWIVDDFDNLYKGSFNERGELSWLLVNSEENLKSFQFIEDNQGNLYAYRSKIMRYDPITNQFKSFLSHTALRGQEIDLIKSLAVHDNQFIIVSYEDKIVLFDNADKEFQLVSDELSTQIEVICYGSTGTIWLGTSDGLIELSTRYKWNYLLHNSNSRTSSRQEATCILEDQQNNIWIGTKSESIYKFDKKLQRKDYYIGTPISAILEDYKGTIWVTSGNIGTHRLYYFDESADTFAISIHSKKNFDFQSLSLTNQGEIISGGKGALMLIKGVDFRNDQLKIDSCVNLTIPLEYTQVNPIIQDRNDDYWMAVNGSQTVLYHYDTKDATYSCYPIFSKTSVNEYVYALEEVGSTTLWLGTSVGLIEFDKFTKKVLNHYTTGNGLSTNNICGLLKDANENLWISTRRGLTYLNVTTREINNFSYTEKLAIETFHDQTSFKNIETGQMYFGGNNGIVYFHPDSLLNFIQNSSLPQVIISQFNVFGEALERSRPIYEIDSIQLNQGENYIDIQYLVPHPGNSNCSYRHRLVGYEENWIYHTDPQLVSYSNLSPGDYQFQVQAKSFNNHWEENSRMLNISIPPFFWQTFWFRLALFAIISSIIAAAIYLRFRFLRLEKEAQEKELQRKTAMLQALSSQMNPHFLYNSLNSINNFIAHKDPRKANEYLGDFATLMRMILNHSKMEKISLTKELECLQLYLKLEHLRAAEKFDYTFNVDTSLDTGKIFVPPMVIQPFVENAIWHGLHHKTQKGSLDLTISRDNGHIVCHVIDDGIGIRRSQEMQKGSTRKSTGIENVRERLRILNGIDREGLKVEVKERPIEGTHVEIVIAGDER